MSGHFQEMLYTPISEYKADQDYLRTIKEHSQSIDCIIRPNDFYYNIDFKKNVNLPSFGWKIHISSMNSNSEEIFNIVSKFCLINSVDFKFIKDKNLLNLINSKQWGRASSGKFITIYPNNEPHFVKLLKKLKPLLQEFVGPYILSDRRYDDSKVLFYRYGRINCKDNEYKIFGPDNEIFIDEPLPFFQKPSWISDPFENEKSLSNESTDALLNHRYQIEKVLHTTNSGGIYLALDCFSKQKVVLKEARPFTMELPNGMDSVSLKQLERDILIELELFGINFTPRYIDYFQEWEHHFLVINYIEGISLSDALATPERVAAIRNKDRTSIDKWFNFIWNELSNKLSLLRDLGISHGDITPENILIDKHNNLFLLDFELSITNSIKNPSVKFLETAGFRFSKINKDFSNRFILDQESFGLTLLRLFCTGNRQIYLHKGMPLKFLKQLYRDNVISYEQYNIIKNLIYNNKKTIEILESEIFDNDELYNSAKSNIITKDFIDKSGNFLLECLNYPSDSKQPIFKTISQNNKFSYLYGDLGIIKTLKSGMYPQHNIKTIAYEYILHMEKEFKITPDFKTKIQIINGLNELGLYERAKFYFKENINYFNKKYVFNKNDISIEGGISGLGLLTSSLFMKNNDDIYLKSLENYADSIVKLTQKSNMDSICKENCNNKLGFFNGLSGIPFFLIEVYKIIKKEIYISTAKLILEYLINNLVSKGTDLFIEIEKGNKRYSPYLNGASGLIKSLNKYNEVEPIYNSIIQGLINGINFKYCQNATYLGGLAGMGEVLLSIHTNKNTNVDVVDCIKDLNDGIQLFSYSSAVFLGNNMNEIELSFGNGTSGIIQYLINYKNLLDKNEIFF